MKVTDDMFGRPGKCVACRQKIRIPKADQVPPGTTEIHIKDHPELLRKSKKSSDGRNESVAQAKPASGASFEYEAISVPLDVYEPLRTLCCLQRKIDRQMQSMSHDGNQEEARRLLREGDRLASLRAELNESFTRGTGEAAAELAGVNDRIAKAEVSLRSGEGVFAELRTFLDALRNRREILERWVINLQGWRQVTDPHGAGGYMNLPLENAPTDVDAPQIPTELPEGSLLLDHYVEALRSALARRDELTRALDDLQRPGGAVAALTPMALDDLRNDNEAARRRAEAQILFLRERLNQLGNDYAQDMIAIQAESDRVRRRFYDRLLDEASYKSLERNLLRMKEDCSKAGAIITRALIASSSEDVPQPRRTFLQRLAPGRQEISTDTEADQWVAWFSALIMGTSVFFPINSSFSVMTAFQNPEFRAEPAAWTLLLPWVLAMAIAIAAYIPWRAGRSIMLGLLASLCLLLTAIVLHESKYGTGVLATAFWRESTSWYLRPGLLICVLGQLGVLTASFIGIRLYRRLLKWYWGGLVALFAIILLVVTNFIGLFNPMPTLSLEATPAAGYVDLVVAVQNRGGRDVVLTRSVSHLASAFTWAVNGIDAQGVRGSTPAPVSTEIYNPHNQYDDAPKYSGNRSETRISPNGRVQMHFRVQGGKYEATLSSAFPGARPFETQTIELETPPPPPTPEPRPGEDPADDGLPGTVTTAPLPEPPRFGESEKPATSEGEEFAPAGTRVLLNGVVAAPDTIAKVSITVFLPNRPPENRNIPMGDTLISPWRAQEYNPQLQTVTISDGRRVLVLRKGEVLPL